MKRWWRVTAKVIDGSERVFYCLGLDWESAAGERRLFDPAVTLSGMPVEAHEVPWKVRARYETNTEELREWLKERGWKVVLR